MGSDVKSLASRQQRSAVRWGITSSVIFGSVGWVIGMTIPGDQRGTSLLATFLWSLVMGALGYIPGDTVGRTSAELQSLISR
jgi:hypothetical protein